MMMMMMMMMVMMMMMMMGTDEGVMVVGVAVGNRKKTTLDLSNVLYNYTK
jgi:hypothetical protein